MIGTWQALAGTGPGPDIAHLPSTLSPTASAPEPGLGLGELAALEARWTPALAGTALVHGDLRRDNFLREPGGRLRVVDWTHRWTGPGWLDLVTLGPDLAAAGLDPQAVLDDSIWRDAPAADVDTALAGVAGYWFNAGRRTPVPHSPGLRELQREQAKHALHWLARRRRG